MSRSVIVDLSKIFRASYSAVLPDKIIRKFISYDQDLDTLDVTGTKYNLTNKNVYVVGAGKAVQNMAREVDGILGTKVKKGIISIPAKSLAPDAEKTLNSNFIYYEGAQDNLPDIAAEATAQKIKDLATSLTKNDFLLILISGGGSALLPLAKEPITLEEKLVLIKKLANSGADINELNIVRKKVSAIKGGKLAIAANPAQTVTLILSDVVNDPLDIIASGPTVEDHDGTEKAVNIIKKHNLYEQLPQSIKQVLKNETSPIFVEETVKNYLLGTNQLSILAAYEEAKLNNYTPIVLSRAVVGNVKDIAKIYVKLSKAFTDYLRGIIDVELLENRVEILEIPGLTIDFTNLLNIPKSGEIKFCLILGGETTVEVKGSGKGGRNQQLALEFSNYIHNMKDEFKDMDVFLLSAGTDGIDGPTDAAGAIGYLHLVSDSEKANIDMQEYLENNNSYNFYKKFESGAFHVITGHTNTNVMDTHLIVIQKCL